MTEKLEIKIGVINLSMLIAFFLGLAVGLYTQNIWSLAISFAIPFGVHILGPIIDLIKPIKELRPDGWLIAVDEILNY